ncbi:hypothetical protein [Microseira wollei]|uniref:Uncharacterized protein n=1 Tax=Microseira wollei NIES-4236 TaxID=2530354 RepID=A0AAV3X4T5_9CYAN|nr:hypothetical protein [Microseira wollei]GET36231.1 hypothetical protein MiSe_09790 [Microseira wollei NIES-4236]
MRHPFDLDPAELEAIDLDFAEQLTHEEAAQVGGGLSIATTRAIGEEGGCWPKPWPKPIPIDPPITTKALGEEGGITKALCEDGGGCASTEAIGEEGGITDALCEDGGCASTDAIGEEGGYYYPMLV